MGQRFKLVFHHFHSTGYPNLYTCLFCDYAFLFPFLVALWSAYESAIINIASYLQKRDNISLNLQNIQGDNFLKRAKKYFDDVLQEYIARRNIVVESIKKIPGCFCPKPTGSYYATAKLHIVSSLNKSTCIPKFCC